MRTRLILLTLAALLVAASSAAAASRPPRMSDLMRDYDLRLSLQMKSDFKFQPVTDEGCTGKPMGWSGEGQEIIEMRSPRPVRVTLFTPRDGDPGMTRKDLKYGFPMSGVTRRTGQMIHVVCGEQKPSGIEACLGRHPMALDVNVTFARGTWLIWGPPAPSTREIVPACDDRRFDWDGAVARTGTVPLQPARGAAARSKLKTKGSFSLTARLKEQCDIEYFGVGSCGTEWRYKATFTRVKKKRRPRR